MQNLLHTQHYPVPNHQKVESYEQSKHPSNISNQRIKWECFLLLVDFNWICGEVWPENCCVKLVFKFQGRIWHLSKKLMIFKSFMKKQLTLYSIKEQGIKHLVLSVISSLSFWPRSVLPRVLYWYNEVQLSHSGSPAILNFLQGGWHPTCLPTYSSTQLAKL